jgi:hypothetical protein
MQRWPPVPYTPTLNPISNPDGDGNYTVSWSTALLADTYELQEDSSCAFPSPTVVYSGSGNSKSISGRAPGTYYYRVRGCNSYGCGSWSNCRSVTVSPASQPIVNGDFEAGPTGWTQYSSHGWDVITTDFPGSVSPRSGSWAAWEGGEDDDISYVQQQVTVPPSQPYLSYWHWIASEDDCGYDFAGVVINDSTVVDVYPLCWDENTGGWERHTVNLGAYAGQSVSLQIRTETDSSLNSNLFVDDVSFQASALSHPSSQGVADNRQAAPRSGPGAPRVVEEEPQPARLFR